MGGVAIAWLAAGEAKADSTLREGGQRQKSSNRYNLGVEITFDPAKDAENRRKHGIPLSRASELDVTTAMYDVDASQDYGEVRWNAVGWLRATLHTFTFTDDRAGALRAISLRKATKEEQRRYAEQS